MRKSLLSRAARGAVSVSPLLFILLSAANADAASLSVGVVSSSLKVRQADKPAMTPMASIKAAKNEFEAFQIVITAGAADVAAVSAKLGTSLTGPGGANIPDANVVLYAERYYNVAVPSNDEGAPGLWPDALVPDVDTYVGEKRNAFPVTVAAGQSGVVWVDVLVPIDQQPGDYAGSIEIDVAGAMAASVPVQLHVGNFVLPSTATLSSAYGMGWGTVPQVHCGGAFPFCATEDAANAIRALYVRAALEHRFTISNTDFQPPFGGSQAPFEKYVLPLINGTSAARLPGAKLTSVVLDGGTSTLAQWIAYAKSKTFFDRLFYYPVDEPGTNAATWTTFATDSSSLHAADPAAQICLTSSMQDAQMFSAQNEIDIFVPVLDQMYGRPSSSYAGDQRGKYDAWLAANASRKLWMYQSCDQHGCGVCGAPSPGVDYTGWPERVIDSSGVQDRAFGWVAWQERVEGELYFATDYQLATAWDDGGQCAFSGSGDGTIFYPGKPSVIGGMTDIPIESIRMKMIREGMEDYEYLAMVAKTNGALATSAAAGLFPTAYDCAKTPEQLEAARDQLFAALDVPLPHGGDGGVTSPDGGGVLGDGGIVSGEGGRAGGGDAGSSGGSDGGGPAQNGDGGSSSGCDVAPSGASSNGALMLLGGVAIFLAGRRRRLSLTLSPDASLALPGDGRLRPRPTHARYGRG